MWHNVEFISEAVVEQTVNDFCMFPPAGILAYSTKDSLLLDERKAIRIRSAFWDKLGGNFNEGEMTGNAMLAALNQLLENVQRSALFQYVSDNSIYETFALVRSFFL